jgi:hypothetical protein
MPHDIVRFDERLVPQLVVGHERSTKVSHGELVRIKPLVKSDLGVVVRDPVTEDLLAELMD